MIPDPVVVSELRLLFQQGATPSRLIQHILERHAGEEHLQFFVQDYFREAFGVDIVRGVTPFDKDRYDALDYAFLNNDVLAEMIEKQAGWNPQANHAEGEPRGWLAGLTTKSIYQHLDEAARMEKGELSDLWSRLNPKDKADLQRLVAGNNWKYEKVKILSRLAERLQQRVTELEGQLEKVSEIAKG